MGTRHSGRTGDVQLLRPIEADLALRPRRFEHDAVVQRATVKISSGHGVASHAPKRRRESCLAT